MWAPINWEYVAVILKSGQFPKHCIWRCAGGPPVVVEHVCTMRIWECETCETCENVRRVRMWDMWEWFVCFHTPATGETSCGPTKTCQDFQIDKCRWIISSVFKKSPAFCFSASCRLSKFSAVVDELCRRFFTHLSSLAHTLPWILSFFCSCFSFLLSCNLSSLAHTHTLVVFVWLLSTVYFPTRSLAHTPLDSLFSLSLL